MISRPVLVSLLALFLAVPNPSAAQTATEPSRAQDAAAVRAETRTRLLREADEAATMLAADGERPDATTLRLQEVRSRVLAALLDERESAAPAGVRAAARALKADARVPAAARYELARLLTMAERKGRKFSAREEWLAAREAAARQLIRDSPGVDFAYDELLAVAAVSDGPRALRLAQELAAAPASPALKAHAAVIANRSSAPGQPLPAVLADLPGGAPLVERSRDRILIFYTWTPDDARSMDLAKSLAAAAPPEALVLGINLGPEASRALALARETRLPGEQLYGARAHDSPVVRRLGLTIPSQLYAVGRDGLIRDLTASADRAAALAKLN